jgi:RHS repeat-associated protein
VDEAWLATATYPVEIDPTFSKSSNNGANGNDTYVQSSICCTSQWSATELKVGNTGAETRRAYLWFPLGTLPMSRRVVLDAHIDVYNDYSTSCTAKPMYLYPLASGFTSSTVWSNQPGWLGGPPVQTASFAHGYSSSCPAAVESMDVSDLAAYWVESGGTNWGVGIMTQNEGAVAGNYFYSGETGLPPTLYVHYETRPTATSAVTPAANAVMTSPPAAFQVNAATDDEGSAVQYYLRVATGPDAETGQIVYNSGWQTGADPTVYNNTTHTFTPGAQVTGLPDGTYWWHVWTWDGAVNPDTMNPGMPPQKFVVNRRLGNSAVSPMQPLGPVSVNLATGNASATFASPSISTVGGNVGVSLTYNSQATSIHGLQATYFRDDTTSNPFAINEPGDFPVLSRVDPNIAFDWSTGSPEAGVPADGFLVRWTGTITFAGAYAIGADADDGVRIDIDNNGWDVNDWTDQAMGTPVFSSGTFTGTHNITVEYYDHLSAAAVFLRYRASGDTGPGTTVPSAWLAPTATGMPQGWSVSADLDGSLAFTSARIETNRVVLVAADGGTLEYTRSGNVLTPPPGETGVLAYNDADATWSYSPGDGSVYVFDKTGALLNRLDAVDDRTPAAPIYAYTGIPPRLTSITDRVSGATLATLTYGGTCPSGMLCTITYLPGPTQSTTALTYDASGQLVTITDPGGEVTQLNYDTSGRLNKVRDPLGADYAAAHSVETGTTCDLTCTVITYDSAGRVSTVTAPDPDANASTTPARTQVTLTYVDASTTTAALAGSTNTSGWTTKATFDSGGRTTRSWAQDGTSTAQTWAAADRDLVATATNYATDGTTVVTQSGTVYDSAYRPIRQVGPAPDAAVDNTTGDLVAGQTAPVTTTAYDSGLNGLAVEYWDRSGGSTTSRVHRLGVDAAYSAAAPTWDGRVWANWTTNAPTTGVPSDHWQARFTGYVTIPTSGATYTIHAWHTGQVRVFVDGKLVNDGWTQFSGPGYTDGTTIPVVLTDTSTPKPIEVDFADNGPTGSNALLSVTWDISGGPSGQEIPAANLTPGYGLVTSSTDPDGKVTTTTYSNGSGITPALGVATATTQDPAGQNLTTTAGYETPGTGYLRRTIRTLPAGNSTTYNYYGATETKAPPADCGGGTAVAQRGALARTVAADPDDTGAGGSVIHEYVYDLWGRPIATRVGTSTSGVLSSEPWSCTTYDARGRTVQVTQPAYGIDTVGRTITTDYTGDATPAVAEDTGDAMVTTLNDSAGTITSTADLTGRIVSYSDVFGNTTTTSYDQAGRVIQTSGPGGVVATTYDANGHVVTTSLDGSTVVDMNQADSYDTAGRPNVYRYGNGTRSGTTTTPGLTYDVYGRATGQSWYTNTGTLLTSDTITRSLAGRYTDETIDGVDANTSGVNFQYDGAGRLYDAYAPGHHLQYAYAASTPGCTLAPAAGKNTNRTSVTDNGGTATTYCYDNADRLASTTHAGIGTLAYDSHGNTTTIAGETHGYDWADRHLTTDTATAAVRYTRDATDRIVTSTSSVTVHGTPTNANNGGTTSSLILSTPSGATAGDLLVAQMATTGSGALTPPSGWTSAAGVANGTAVRSDTYWHLVAAGDPTSWAFGLGTVRSAAGGITAYTGADPASPIGATATSTAMGTALAATGMTTTRYDSQLAVGWALAGNVSTSTPPSGMTSRTDAAQGTAVRSVGYDELRLLTAATGARTLTASSSTTAAMVAVQINPLIVRYGTSGSGDTPDFTQNSAGTVLEKTLALSGGTLLTIRGTAQTWTYPNVHGDGAALADSSGSKQGATLTWDPFGSSLSAVPDNSAGTLDYGWLGRFQRPTEHQAGLLSVVEMGARQYSSGLGRFLEADPIEGGSANSYEYVAADPINNQDLDGMRCLTGVANRVPIRATMMMRDKRTHRVRQVSVVTGYREVCRSISRGAGRVIRRMGPPVWGVVSGSVAGVACGGTFGVATLGWGALGCGAFGGVVGLGQDRALRTVLGCNRRDDC